MKKSIARGWREWGEVPEKASLRFPLTRDLNEVRKQVVVEECSRQKEYQGKGPEMKMCCMCLKKAKQPLQQE